MKYTGYYWDKTCTNNIEVEANSAEEAKERIEAEVMSGRALCDDIMDTGVVLLDEKGNELEPSREQGNN